MEEENPEVILENGQLAYVGRDCEEIPPHIGAKHGPHVTRLDLSFNLLKSLGGLESFPNLEELIIDNNDLINSSITLPALRKLHTLSLNNNKIEDLDPLLDEISKKCPMLTYLTLLGNTACPNQLSSLDKDEEDYQRYRHYVLFRLPGLKFLDSSPTNPTEKNEASRVGPFLKVVKPTTEDLENQLQNNSGKEEQTEFSPLPQSSKAPGKHGGTFGSNKYVYYGKHSEGNRFIRNNDL